MTHKITVGGGGVDAEGNWFRDEDQTIQMTDAECDEWQQRLIAFMRAPREPATIVVSAEFVDAMREALDK